MTQTPSEAHRPFFSIVSACYQVGQFLDDFIASIDAQEFPADRFEVVMVDDGSTDETQQLLQEWSRRRPRLVRVITQENAGQGAARNAGMAAASGVWITFPDPDDILEQDYLSRVAAMIERHPTVHMVATNRCLLDDTTGEVKDRHPLRSQFRKDGVYNLATNDSFFHGGAVAAFMRLDHLRESRLVFDDRIRPNFEDGHFCASYLLLSAAPTVAFVTARYLYRKRADGTSTLQNALGDPGRYTTVLRLGYLDILQRAADQYGRPPLWLQNFIIYELSYYLGREDSVVGALAPAGVREEFHQLLGEVTALLDPLAVRSYRRTHVSATTRNLLQHGWRGERWVQPYAVVRASDPVQSLVEVTYQWVGEAPRERVLLGGREVEPAAAKIRDVIIQGRSVLQERILWLPAKRLRLELDGTFVEILPAEPAPASLAIRPQDLPLPHGPLDGTRARHKRRTLREHALLRLAGSAVVRQRFRDAWVLMDRIHNADDSAEHLFRHLRAHAPRTNAWFVVEEDTPDWERLRAEFGRRVVPHGSDTWKLLMLNATHLISSHADAPIVNPPSLRPFGPRRARFVFLQHGVIKDDLSGWLNPKPIDLFVTSTQGEYDSVVGDHTPYRYTTKETVLTGLPRFDMLMRSAERYPAERRDLILLSPTWRNDLVAPLEADSQRREAYDWITETEYWKNWTGLLLDEQLRSTARAQGLKVALLPHPNMDSSLGSLDLPDDVARFSFDGEEDVRDLFARAAVLVTDYSSTAFNAAYIGRPVVYFQFDHTPGDESRHVGLPGYFDYERDGFGPVAYTLPQALAEIQASVEQGREPRSPWRERIEAAFPSRDDQNCARVTAAIRRMGRRRKLVYRA